MSVTIAPPNSVIVKVCFNTVTTSGTVTKYSFLAPKGFDKTTTPFVIVPANVLNEYIDAYMTGDDVPSDKDIINALGTGNFVIAKVHSVLDPTQDLYKGPLKWIIAGFNPLDYMSDMRDQKRREVINARLRQLAQEVQDRKSLKEVFGDDMPEEAKAMFAELNALDEAIKGKQAPALTDVSVKPVNDKDDEKK